MNDPKNPASSIIERLRQGGQILISGHISPDGDSIGSQLAMYDLCLKCGSEPMIINHDSAFPKYAYLSKCALVHVYDKNMNYPQFDCATLLEAPERARIGDVQALLSPNCFVINIDHHQGNLKYGDLNLVDESAEAAAVLIYDLFQSAGIALTADNADELFTAILTDTGRFRFANTTPRALRVCSALLALGANPKKISDALYACFPESQLRMMGELLSGMELFHNARTCVLSLSKQIRERFPGESAEIEGLADYTLFTCGVQVGALLREIESSRTKISLRSHDSFDVSVIASVHGGGGHKNAAGCYISKPITEAKQILLEQIGAAL